MELQGARALVTGAAGGIGPAIGRALAAAGADLVVSGRTSPPLAALAAELGAEVVVGDLADEGGLRAVTEAARAADVLVANAAVVGRTDLAAETEASIDEVLAVNLRAPIVLATAFAQAHVGRPGSGAIVLISSIAGMAATPDHRLYNATKFGLRGFGLGLRHDLAADGIGVTVVTPGYIRDVGMFARSGEAVPPLLGSRTGEDVGAAVVRAVRTNPAEIIVATPQLVLAARAAAALPGLAGRALGRIRGVDRPRRQ